MGLSQPALWLFLICILFLLKKKKNTVIISKELSWILWLSWGDYQTWAAQGNPKIWSEVRISWGCLNLQLVPEMRRIGKFDLILGRWQLQIHSFIHCRFILLFFYKFLICSVFKKILVKTKLYGSYITSGSGENNLKTTFNRPPVCLYGHVTENTELCLVRWTIRLLDEFFSRS